MVKTEKIISSIIEAGKKTLGIYAKDDYKVSFKEDSSPLTAADKASNEIIVNTLQETEIPVLSEEGKAIPYTTRKLWKKYWLIDPLDGTKEFINKNGEFTINIALIEKNQPVAGFVYVPVKDTLYIGICKGGIFNGYDTTVAMKSENASKLLNLETIPNIKKEQIVVMGSRSHMNEETSAYIDKLKIKHPDLTFESRGSSLKICALAEGSAHYYPRYAPTMEWDTAAAHAVLLAAGGRILQKNTDKEVIYNKEELLNPHFLAIAKGLDL